MQVNPEEQEEFALAFAAGITRRCGPSETEIENWPLWKQTLCRLTPLKHRWRYSVNAPLIRHFETRL